MYVRRLRAEEAHSWRELRLRALKEAPHAFGSTYKEERRRAAGLWEERTAAFAAGLERVMFVAEVGERLVGCAGAMTEDGEPYVISMWVEPAQRGRRLGAELLANPSDGGQESTEAGQAPFQGREGESETDSGGRQRL